jgi:hypothetical protein
VRIFQTCLDRTWLAQKPVNGGDFNELLLSNGYLHGVSLTVLFRLCGTMSRVARCNGSLSRLDYSDFQELGFINIHTDRKVISRTSSFPPPLQNKQSWQQLGKSVT